MSQTKYWNYRFATDSKGRRPAEEFYNGLSKGDRTKFLTLWNMVAYTDQYHNDERFKKLKLSTSDKIWQFRVGHYRMLCYRSGKYIVLTNGFRKDGPKTDPTEINMAIKIKNADTKGNRSQ